jgi:MFS transporter, DHA2 family, methylenomycin A resistance protein
LTGPSITADPIAGAPQPAASEKSGYAAVIFLMGLCQLVLTTDFSIVSVALPSIGRSLQASPALLSWVVSATALTFAGFLVLGGRLSDLLGHRRCLLAGLILFGTGSLCSAGATSIYLLIPSRALQGLGAALLSPASFSLITTLIPEGPQRHRALGVFGMMQGASVIIGLVVGGYLTTSLGWRSVFLLNAPFILLAIGLVFRVVPRAGAMDRGVFKSALGAALLTVATAMLLWSFSLLGEMLHGSYQGLIVLVLAIAAFAAFFFFEWRAHAPLVPRAIYTPALIAGAMGGAGLLAGVAGVFILANLYMQTVLKYSAAYSGVGMLPYAMAVVAAGQLVPLVLSRISMRNAVIGGFALNIAGLLVFASTAHTLSYPVAIVIASILTPLGSLIAFMALMGEATAGVSTQHQGLASAVLFTCQQLGLALGGTLCLSVLAASESTHGTSPGAFAVGYCVAAGLALAGLVLFLARSRVREASGLH